MFCVVLCGSQVVYNYFDITESGILSYFVPRVANSARQAIYCNWSV